MSELDFVSTRRRLLCDEGAVADVYAMGVGVEGWQRVLDLPPNEGWPWTYTEDNVARPLRSVPEIFEEAGRVSCRFEFRGIEAVSLQTTFFNPTDVELWFQPREIRSPDQLDGLCKALRLIGRTLGSDILVSTESHPEFEHFHYELSRDAFVGPMPLP